MKKVHHYFFGLCGDLASKSHHPQHRHGSIVVHRRSAVIGRGFNRSSLHAEVSSVKSVNNYRKYENLVVYVCRVNTKGEYMDSTPCTSCMKFMRNNGVSRVYFSGKDGLFTKIKL